MLRRRCAHRTNRPESRTQFAEIADVIDTDTIFETRFVIEMKSTDARKHFQFETSVAPRCDGTKYLRKNGQCVVEKSSGYSGPPRIAENSSYDVCVGPAGAGLSRLEIGQRPYFSSGSHAKGDSLHNIPCDLLAGMIVAPSCSWIGMSREVLHRFQGHALLEQIGDRRGSERMSDKILWQPNIFEASFGEFRYSRR